MKQHPLQDYIVIGKVMRNAGNHGNDRKFHKCDQIPNQTKRNIDELYLGKISLQKTIITKFSVDSRFLNIPYGKKENPETQSFLNKKHEVLTVTITRKLLKSNQFVI